MARCDRCGHFMRPVLPAPPVLAVTIRTYEPAPLWLLILAPAAIAGVVGIVLAFLGGLT